MEPKDQGNGSEEEIDLMAKIQQAKQEDEERQEEDAAEGASREAELEAELAKMTEHAKRLMADMQNIKKRQEEEGRQMIFMANANLIKNLLPGIDNLRRALEHKPEEAKEWADGIEMSVGQVNSAMESAGLKPIDALNQPFNPDQHEALVHSPGEKDMVVDELEKGYMLGDRLLRPAKVAVGNGEKE